MTVKELIDTLQQFDEDKLVLVEDTEYKEFQAIDVEPVDDRFVIITTLTCLTGFVLQWAKEVNSINANGLYVICKAGSNRAGFIKFND